MAYETILVEPKGAVALITLNRPKALNALNRQTLTDLVSAYDALVAGGQTRAVVLTGGGEKAFAAGATARGAAAAGPMSAGSAVGSARDA